MSSHSSPRVTSLSTVISINNNDATTIPISNIFVPLVTLPIATHIVKLILVIKIEMKKPTFK